MSAGYFSTCALTAVRAVQCWGLNDAGTLGDGGTATSATPVDAAGLSGDVAGISVGGYQACALVMTETLKCWGNNQSGELGIGTSTGPEHCLGACSKTPVAVLWLDKPATSTPTASAELTATRTATRTRTSSPTPTRTLSSPAHPGDANRDGRVDAVDAALTLQYSAGVLHSISPTADANQNGLVDAIDAALILQFVARLIAALPP